MNYELLVDRLNYFEKIGFVRKEVPWVVAESVSNITAPTAENLPIGNNVLVGSGEQGFLANMNEFKRKGKFVTLTPCFRIERHVSKFNQLYFMKVELIDFIQDTSRQGILTSLDCMINTALNSFLEIVPDKSMVTIENISFSQTDILVNGIEVGSYGYREYQGCHWIYGTGIAEPRFTLAVNHKKPA